MKKQMSELSKKAQNITNWLTENCRTRNARGFLIDFGNPSVPEVLALLLANKTRRPCQTMLNSYDPDRPYILSIARNNSKVWSPEKKDAFDWGARLASIAEEYKLLVISPINIAERLLVRSWKHFTLIADLFPFGNMTKNEIEEMFAIVTDLEDSDYKQIYGARAKNNEPYSKDFDLTHEDLNWALQANKRYDGIIDNQKDPAKHPKWFSFSIKQKKIIAFLHQHSKLTAHKMTTTAKCYD